MTTQRTGSFPFFWVARDYGIPYADVLRIAGGIELHRVHVPTVASAKDIPPDAFSAIFRAAVYELMRRNATQH